MSAVLISLIIAHHFIQIRNSTKEDTINVYVIIVTYVILGTALIWMYYHILNIFGVITPVNDSPIKQTCNSMQFIFTGVYWLNKTSMHFSYLIRLTIAYKDSIFEINRYFLAICYVLSTLYFISVMTIEGICFQGHYIWNPANYSCDSTRGYLLVDILVPALYDFFISFVCLFLFLRPIFRLKMYATVTEKLFIFKIGLLNSIIIISSIASFILYMITAMRIYAICDYVIISSCVLLMFKVHHKMFQWLCCINKCWDLERNIRNKHVFVPEITIEANETISV